MERLGYDFVFFGEEAMEPDLVDIRFKDLIPEFSDGLGHARYIANKRLYEHQLKAFEALTEGKNVILISGAGSGKTEAWFIHLRRNGVRGLVIYPTLALANDQVRRLEEYTESIRTPILALDAKRTSELRAIMGYSRLREGLKGTQLLITNPAFLINDVKKWGGKGLLEDFCSKLGLLVIDEFDFYGPREISLLLGMIKIIKERAKGLQVAILTATLGNPEEMAKVLTEMTGRETVIIPGKSFRQPNFSYVVLGRDMKKVWEEVKRYENYIVSSKMVGKDILRALKDFEEFKRSAYRVVEVLEYLGIRPPRLDLDPTDLLASYLKDRGVTLVFTKSIKMAEELVRRMAEKFGKEVRERVASHHHLIFKSERERIERGAREGRIKVIISPRTLAQGIDVGTIVRVVHYGLPESTREFKQREGRKGRRREITFTESIILPITRWDRELLLRGAEALHKWVSLTPEKAIVNPDNEYEKLFLALFKAARPNRGKLSEEEAELLERLGLWKAGNLTKSGKLAYQKLNFYEFGPPYGIKRMLKRDGEKYLEEIGHCDLVERFQPGCIDYTSDAIVTGLMRRGEKVRAVTAVVEEPLHGTGILNSDLLAYTVEEYYRVKHRWGEEGNVFRDYYSGRLHSEVLCVVDPPTYGFGKYTKMPNRVYWVLHSKTARPIVSKGRTYFVKQAVRLPIVSYTGGRYTDYTYGLSVELDPKEDLEWIRVGLAFIMLVLRLKYGVPFDTIYYDLANVGNRKILLMHEPESAGLLYKLDWGEVRKRVKKFQVDELSDVLLEALDEQAYLSLAAWGFRWEEARKSALRVLDYLTLRDKMSLRFRGKILHVPKPSRALKLASIQFLYMPVNDYLSFSALALFDGETTKVAFAVKERNELSGVEDFNLFMDMLTDQGFTFLTYDLHQFMGFLSDTGMKSVSYKVLGLKDEDRLMNVSSMLKKPSSKLPLPEDEVYEFVGWGRKVHLKDVWQEFESSKKALTEKGWHLWPNYIKYLRAKALAYVEEGCELLYQLYLGLREFND
jgi:DEAD/DEAH box helicase domain-containing protein